jgi:carbon monoxide dehydrogenase subunit G
MAALAVTELRRIVVLAASPAAVWERLWDVGALARCIPGCDEVQVIEVRRRYRATIRDRVGPFRVAIPLEILVEAAPPERLVVAASGRDATLGSPVKVGLTVTLSPESAGGTRLGLDGQAQIGGKLATLGQGLIQRRTRDVLDQFAANLAALFAPPGDSGPA